MAERRMLTRKVTDDDHFTDLSSSAQALYLHLTMSADDDGFCNQLSTAMFRSHASVQDLEALLEKRFLLQFDNGVIVIKHWRMANALRKDRYTPTAFQEELAKLKIKENGSYTMAEDAVASWLPDGCQVVATGKNRQEENRQDKDRLGQAIGNGPSLDEVCAFAKEIDSKADPERFYDYYLARGWKIGNDPINDWRALFRKWTADERPKKQYTTAEQYRPPQKIDVAQLQKIKEVFGIEDE